MRTQQEKKSILSHISFDVALLFIVGITLSITQPYESLIAVEYLGFSNLQFGIILFFMAVFGASANILMGYFSDIISSRKTTIMIALAAGAIGYTAFSVFENKTTFLICFLLLNPLALTSFYQLFGSIRNKVDRFETQNAASINSIVRSIFSASWIVGPFLIGLWIARSGNLFDAFMIASVGYSLCFVIFCCLKKENSRNSDEARKNVGSLKKNIADIFSSPIFLRVVCIALISVAHPINAAVLPLMVADLSQHAVQHVGYIFGFVAALEIPFMLALIPLTRRYGISYAVILGGLIFATYLALLTLAVSLTQIYVLAVLNAAGAAAMLSLHISFLQDLLPGRPGLGTSLLSIGNLISRGLAALIFAAIGSVFSIPVALAVCGLMVMVGVMFLLYLEVSDRFQLKQRA